MALILPLAWEPPKAMSAALKKQKKKIESVFERLFAGNKREDKKQKGSCVDN